jgi:hypothetical protein
MLFQTEAVTSSRRPTITFCRGFLMNSKAWIPVALFILATPLILNLLPYPYSDSVIFVFILIFIPYSIYRRGHYSKGEILFQLAQDRGPRILGGIISIVFFLFALFFVMVGIKSFHKGFAPSLYQRLMLLGAIVLFGSAPFFSTGKLLLLEDALVGPGMAIRWRNIRDWKWIEVRNKNVYGLMIYFNLFGIRIPFMVRGFSPDINTRKEMDKIFEEKIRAILPVK